jgi:hypothetical protein
MKESATRLSVLHVALIAIGFVVIVGLLVRYLHHRHSPGASLANGLPAAVATPASPVTIVTPIRSVTPALPSTAQILAACHPHLRLEPTSVPNIEPNDNYNMAGVKLKVRFWVNGDGFVTRSFVIGFTVVSAADQQTELDFVQHLTFTVPGTEECRAQPLEMIGNFSESREAAGEWATVLEIHPLYSFEGSQVVQRP